MSKLGAVDALAAAVKTHVAVLGMTGMGKSWLVRGELERELDAGAQVLVLDPTGVHYGIRLKADGKTPSQYKVVVIGGDHGDLPLNPDYGEKLARTLGTSSTSAVIDMRGLSVKHSIQFFTAFAETLLGANRGARRLVIDEAHRFMPQSGGRIDPRRGQMLHAANELVSGGRSAGLGVMMLSQRPAKVHKDSLTQCQALVALGVFHNLDRKAIEVWVAGQSDKAKGEELVASLAELPVGTGWVWAPRFGVFEKVQFPKIKTFDSMKPLGAGESPAALPQIDVEELRLALAPPARSAPAKREISPSSNEAAKIIAPTPKEQRALEAARAREIEAAVQRGYQDGYSQGHEHGFGGGFQAAMRAVSSQLAAIRQPSHETELKPPTIKRGTLKAPEAVAQTPEPRKYAERFYREPQANGADLGAERKALGPLVSAYPGGLSEAQWALAAGYKRTGGTWGTYKSRLRSGGMAEQRDGLWYATKSAILAMGDQVPVLPQPGPELVEFWAGKMSGKAADMLRLLAGSPDAIYSREELAAAVGMEPSGGSFGTYLSRLRGVGLVVNQAGGIRVSPALLS